MTSLRLIGEAPGKHGKPGEPALLGRIGRRLARLMGTNEDQYRWSTRRDNLLPRWPGKAPGNGSAWPVKQARRAARRMEDGGLFAFGHDRIVVLLGRRVAAAFGFGGAKWFKPFIVYGVTVVVTPHPSGANRWWNEPANVRRAGRFWRTIWRRAVST